MSQTRYRCLACSLIAASVAACTFDEQPTGPSSPVEQRPASVAEAAPPDASAPEPMPDDDPILISVDAGATPQPSSDPVPPPPAASDPGPPDTDDAGASDAAPAEPAAPCQTACTVFVDIAQRLQLMASDLRALGPDGARQDVRYLDLTHYANAGHGERDLALYRDALSYALNSLSRAPNIVVPQAIDAQALLFRIRLADYGWSAETWERLIASYPYAVSYDANSRTFPIDDTLQRSIRERTGTLTPYVQADWFFSHVVRPPLYYELLGVPASLTALATQLGVSIADDIANQRVARAGFRESGPSNFNRVIERHALPEQRGVLWLTYDFAAGSGFSNVITHPLDFQHASSEVLFSLPNGLHGYMIADGRGARLDKAPSAAVQDAHAADLSIEAGISCSDCHASGGINGRYDEVRDAVTLFGTNAATTDAVLALYKDQATLDALFQADSARYATALAATRLRAFTDGSAHELDADYAALLAPKDVAGVLGIREPQLMAAIAASPVLFPPEVLAMRNPGSTLARDRFDSLFVSLVSALGLGAAERP
ncbi:MAG TPA: hypothetical protein VJR89_12135 [Polyangiales bacterium]|nr:hypothetical protein [Polyangiales bacterium]